MKIIRKTFVSIIATLLLVINFGINPIFATNISDAEDSAAILERAGEISVDIARAVDALDKAKDIFGNESILKGLAGCNIAKGITNFLSITMTILKLTGVFGEEKDPVLDLREHLDNRLDAIDGQLNDINSKLDDIQSSLNEGLRQIDSSLGTISVKLDKENITAAATIADNIRQEKKLFDVSLNNSLQDWYSFNNFQYDDNKLIIEYYSENVQNLEDPDETINTAVIEVDKDVITEALKNHPAWDVNNKETLIKNVFLKVADAIKDQEDFKTYKSITEITISNENLKLTVNEAFANAAYDALVYECTHRIAKEKANDLVKSFSQYCNYLTENNGDYISPLNSQYEIYKKIYAFQGDLLCTYTYNENGQIRTINSNLAEISKQKYICELYDIGAFVAEIAYTSKNYTDDNLKKNIYIPWATAEGKCNELYSNFYKKATDSSGKLVDVNNYCYITNCVLTYGTGKLTSSITADYRTYTNWYGKRNVGYLESNIVDDWTFSVSNRDIANNTDLSKLYCYFQNKNSDSFYNYLYKNNVFKGTTLSTYYPSELITKFIGSNKFAEGDSVEMFVEACHQWDNGKFDKKSADNHDTAIVSASDSNFAIRQKAVADTFNIDTGEVIYSNTVGAVAVYYKSNKHLDDIAMFWDAEYRTRMQNGKDKKTALIGLGSIDAKTYYKESYEGEDSGRDYYKCHVDYHRPYAAIFKVPLAGFSYSDPTNSINRNFVNPGIANNNISFIDDDDKNKLPEAIKGEYDNNRERLVRQFEEVLRSFGYRDEEITRLELNDTYDLEFDRSSCSEITDDTYYCLFANFASKLESFVAEYRELFKNAKEVVDITNNDLNVPISENKLNELIENIIKNDFGDSCKICDSIPKSYIADYIYNKNDGKIYGWAENKYIDFDLKKSDGHKDNVESGKTIVNIALNEAPSNEYNGNIVYYNSEFYEWKQGKYVEKPSSQEYIKKETLPNDYEGDVIYCLGDNKCYKWVDEGEYVRSNDPNLIYAGNIEENYIPSQLMDTSDLSYCYPTSNSKNIRVTYNVKPIIKFLFFLIDDDITKIDYKTIPYFDVKPQLIWTDNNVDKSIDISNDAIKNTNIDGISIKIPVLQSNDNDNNALIYHFDNIKEKAPIETFNCKINNTNGVKYAIINTNSFSPFMVKETYYKSSGNNDNPSSNGDKYKIPSTGIK